AVSFLLLALFLALWRASVIVPSFISPDVADKLLGIALTAPVPLMLLATALIAWGAIAMPWLLRILGVISLGAVIGFLGLAAIAYFGVSVIAVGTVLVLGAAGLALWSVGWVLAEAVIYAVRLIARLTDGAAIVLQRVIDVLMTPGKTIWNWLASFDRARALRLQPIGQAESRIIRVTSGEVDVLEEAAVR